MALGLIIGGMRRMVPALGRLCKAPMSHLPRHRCAASTQARCA
jgi:hypothetical protein